ncbi:MAG TPA: acyl carrier protein [Thermoanaerobaculia bacterium]
MSRILDILEQIRPGEPFAESRDFIADGLLDSYDIVTLVSDLDAAYGISIDGVDIIPENFQNLTAIEALIRKRGVTP